MKFPNHCLGLVEFSTHIRFCELQKASGINTHEKNATRHCAGPAYYRMCLNRRLLFKTKPAAVAPKETITHHFFVSELGRRNCRCSQNLCGGRKCYKWNPANIRKWIARFYYFRHLWPAGSACVLLTISGWVAHRYGQLYSHCSLIYFWVPSSCFCIVIRLSLRVK